MRRGVLGVSLFCVVSCADSRTGPALPDPTGPPPDVEFTTTFGTAPVSGEVVLRPNAGSLGWRYAVEFDQDLEFEFEGTVVGTTRIPYRFDEGGIHHVGVIFFEPDGGEQYADTFVVVNGGGPVEILGFGEFEEGTSFEGLTISPDGSRLFAADFLPGDIFEVNPDDLAFPFRVIRGQPSTEGLSVAPTGDRLFAASKRSGVIRTTIDAVPGVTWHRPPSLGEAQHPQYFIHALDDRRALIGGGGALALIDIEDLNTWTLARDAGGTVLRSGHFDVSPEGSRIAVIDVGSDRIHLLGVAGLSHVRELPLPTGFEAEILAFDPSGTVLYVFGRPHRFLAIDAVTGVVLHDETLPPIHDCRAMCAANPVARTAEGRYVVFEPGFIVDGTTHRPTLTFPFYGGVAASADEPGVFWVASANLILKFAIR